MLKRSSQTNKPYSIKGLGKTVILPHCRFIPTQGGKGKMYHSVTRLVNGKLTTLDCDNLDCSGFCQGHDITYKEFIIHICKGELPEVWTTT